MKLTSKNSFRKNYESESQNRERWLLTYSDMITLLLALFIVLYAISKVDQKKLSDVANQIRSGFGIVSPIASFSLEVGKGIYPDETMEPRSFLYRLWERLGYALKSLKESAKLRLGLAETEELQLTFFLSDISNAKTWEKDPDFRLAMQSLRDLSQDLDLEFVIRVHIPFPNQREMDSYSNDWDFHAHKASLVAQELAKTYQIPKDRISIQAYSQFQSQGKTDTPEAKANQERMEIFIRKRNLKP